MVLNSWMFGRVGVLERVGICICFKFSCLWIIVIYVWRIVGLLSRVGGLL